MSAGLPDAPTPVRALPVSHWGCRLGGASWVRGVARPSPFSSNARYGGAPQSLTLKLPVTINKFFQPTEMAAQDFFQRWKQLSL